MWRYIPKCLVQAPVIIIIIITIIIIIHNSFTLSSTQGYNILCVSQNAWDIRTITATVSYSAVLRTDNAYDRYLTNSIASFRQNIVLHLPRVTRAFPPRRRHCKKTIKVTVKVLELMLKQCSVREDEEVREGICGLPPRLERDATYSAD
jgi:hypothetical protein